MSLLLNIDTATEDASVCVTFDGVALDLIESKNQREHASFIHAAITQLLKNTGYDLKDIDAFAITSGPGSYTGLRVGMATAKGFCYALSKPLIAINTLEVMTKAALDICGTEADLLFCPMIDARRMEVFTAIYNSELEEIFSPSPVLLKEGLFEEYMVNDKLLCFGSGSLKFSKISFNPNCLFEEIKHNAMQLGELASIAFQKKNFTDISYSQPTYFKEFHSIIKTD